MPKAPSSRRRFLASSLAAASVPSFVRQAMAQAPDAGLARAKVDATPPPKAEPVRPPRIKFAVIGINHNHVHRQIDAMVRGGGDFVAFYAKEPDLAAPFAKRYPKARLAGSPKEILESEDIKLVTSAGIPVERAPLAIEAMRHGKDFLSDKPGMVSLQQLAAVRRVQKETGRIYSILYSERHENRATVKAGELVKAGAIGTVVQTLGIGPHRMRPKTRPEWFFDKKRNGGVITDVGSHQFDQFLFFTGSRKAEIVAAQAGNVAHPEYPDFEDFGDVTLRSDQGSGYFRVDWFSPEGFPEKVWGDGRLTVLGTEGYIEVRKIVDVAGRPGGEHLLLVDQKEVRYFDCGNSPLPFGERLIDDILNRTETAMPQEHTFYAMELALRAQQKAKKLLPPKPSGA